MKRHWKSAVALAAITVFAGAAAATAQTGHANHGRRAAATPARTNPARPAANPATASATAETSLVAPRFGSWGFDRAGMDTNVRPGNDFFGFANGTYVRNLQIPADRSRYGMFDALGELSLNRTRAVIEATAAGQNASDADAARISNLWRSYMDEARIERLDAQPLQPQLQAIRAATTREDIARLMGRGQGDFYDSLFGTYINDDARDPTHYAVYIGQSGLGLPDRDYYLTPQFAEKKAAYQRYVEQMLTMIGWENPAERARQIVEYETRVAQASWTRVESRDRSRTYNPMTIAELQAAAPQFPWAVYMQEAQLGSVNRVVVSQNTAVPRLAALFGSTDVDTLKAWEAFHLADSAAPLLSQRFVNAQFEFRGRTLSGQPQNRDRWKRGVAFVGGNVGEGVGRLYVARYFTPQARERMQVLVRNVLGSMRNRIEHLTWMTPATRTEALSKLDHFTVKIGYPDRWRDYSALQTAPDDLYGNARRGQMFEWRREVNRLNGPVDRTEWGMTPQTVNAYYNPPRNEIVFPAAILQPPFFDPEGDMAINYGGIGGVIGHEISHGFDDQGRRSDGMGVLRDWWSPADATAFEAQTTRLGAQYSAFEPLPGARVQGGLTMGENIGDLAGLTVALDAYRASLNGQPDRVIDGYTGMQRVFLGWAQVWRANQRDDALRQQIATDPHSPSQYRVNGVVRNIDAWYEAFNVQPGDALYVPPEQRVRLW